MHRMQSLVRIQSFSRVLHQRYRGRPGLRAAVRPCAQSNRELASVARIFGSQIIAAILGLLLHGSVVAGIYATPNQRAVLWLESQQDQSDGSWRDSSEARTFIQTAEAVLALHQANRRGAPYYAGLTWIENHDPKNIDGRARRLVVLRATQSNVQQDVTVLADAISTPSSGQSGWGLAKRYRASPLDTALVVDALRNAGASFPSGEAINFLKATQLSTLGDQGWAVGASSTIDPYATARVVQALAPLRSADTSLAPILSNAVNALRARVTVSSAPHIRAVTALAYMRIDPSSADARVLLNSLVALQRGDGGFDSGVFVTGLVSQAFSAAEGADSLNDRLRVDVTDAALRTAINESLGRGSMDQLNRGELGRLTTLDISNRSVASLNGLQFAINLTSLNAVNNQISDLAPIANLSNLTTRDLSGNPCPGCTTQVAAGDGDVPIPLWALGLLGVMFAGAANRRRNAGPGHRAKEGSGSQ